jgi:hypothetical protein
MQPNDDDDRLINPKVREAFHTFKYQLLLLYIFFIKYNVELFEFRVSAFFLLFIFKGFSTSAQEIRICQTRNGKHSSQSVRVMRIQYSGIGSNLGHGKALESFQSVKKCLGLIDWKIRMYFMLPALHIS